MTATWEIDLHRGRIVVVGASASGLAAADSLRKERFSGELTMVGAETHLPYDRPPLSKKVLSGAWAPTRTQLRSDTRLDALDATWRLGVHARALDLERRVVTLADSSVLGFDGLVIATGVSARHLPGVRGVRGVFTLRTVEDAEALRDEFSPGRELVVVGGGFLGCEVAAVARRFGMNVTVVDPLDEPLLRQLGATVASRVRRLHEENGVRMRTGVGVSSVVEAEGGVTGVRLTDGQVLAADAVLVAIGSTPNTEWLSGSGVGVTDGVEADKFCRVAPGVVAAGDVARWFHVGLGRTVRIEHRMNASEQGAAAARSLLQRSDEPFAPIPYFWSDQYDTKLQAYGIPSATADVVPVRGNLNDERFAVMYVEAGQTVGALVWNMPREALALRADVAAAYASQSTQAPV